VWQKKDLMKSTPEQLQAITLVMFATALLPGGNPWKFNSINKASIPQRLSRLRHSLIKSSILWNQ
jgi:hypothetical protein